MQGVSIWFLSHDTILRLFFGCLFERKTLPRKIFFNEKLLTLFQKVKQSISEKANFVCKICGSVESVLCWNARDSADVAQYLARVKQRLQSSFSVNKINIWYLPMLTQKAIEESSLRSNRQAVNVLVFVHLREKFQNCLELLSKVSHVENS